MFFKFLNRLLSSKQSIPENNPSKLADTAIFNTIAQENNAHFFPNFKLFYHDTHIKLDLLLFFPNHGIYFGETLPWTIDEIKNATLERSSKRSEKSSVTHLESYTQTIHQKLQDILSFDSTPIHRFIWLPNLTEMDFDSLDNSFQEFLPKSFVIFKEDSPSSAYTKLKSMAEESETAYSPIKVIGSLVSHTLLLPDTDHPFGRFLSDEQMEFISHPIEKKLVQLYGDFGSGKSTVLTRKILSAYLENRDMKIIIITPSLLSGELLRDELIALIEYSVLNLPLTSFYFYLPEHIKTQEFEKHSNESCIIICDDTNRIALEELEYLQKHHSHQPMIWSVNELITESSVHRLYKRYHNNARHFLVHTTNSALMLSFLSDLRKRLTSSSPSDILVVLDTVEQISIYQTAIGEYLNCECRIVTSDFSLQYQNLDALLLSVPESLSGLSIPHLYLIGSIEETKYPFILSRASETATIITPSKS